VRLVLDTPPAWVEVRPGATPAAAKGRYIKGITLTTTMGPGLHVDPTRTRDVAGSADAEAAIPAQEAAASV
jgi:large subunit ribosomal protein L1